MALARRDSWRKLWDTLTRIEDAIKGWRVLQLQDQPGAENALNMLLDQWRAAMDNLVLESYEKWARDNQSPDYHG